MSNHYYLKCDLMDLRIYTTDSKIKDKLFSQGLEQTTQLHYSTLTNYESPEASQYLVDYEKCLAEKSQPITAPSSPLEDRLSRTYWAE